VNGDNGFARPRDRSSSSRYGTGRRDGNADDDSFSGLGWRRMADDDHWKSLHLGRRRAAGSAVPPTPPGYVVVIPPSMKASIPSKFQID
jgi:hypothetical protein